MTYGPLWSNNTWACTSDADYIVYGTVRDSNSDQIAIDISGLGTQSRYSIDPQKMQSFTVGSPRNHSKTITKTNSVIGWCTLQPFPDAKASCIQS